MKLEQICQSVGITKDNQYYCRARSVSALDCKYLGNLYGPRKKAYRVCEKPNETAIGNVFRNLKYMIVQMYYSVVK